MPDTSQSRKYSLGLAGEFLVAGELLRRGIIAAVTYGNAKRADVVAMSGDRAVSLEVKTTSEPKWVHGDTLPADSENLWTLVYLPQDTTLHPEYWIVSSRDLRDLLLPAHTAYNERFYARHNREYAGRGVVSIRRSLLAERHWSGDWEKIRQALAPGSSV